MLLKFCVEMTLRSHLRNRRRGVETRKEIWNRKRKGIRTGWERPIFGRALSVYL
jgi:hypothetical protein